MLFGSKRLRRVLMVTLGLLPSVALLAVPKGVAQELPSIQLRCNSVFPLASALSWPQIKWGEEIEKLSKGKIKVQNLSQAIFKNGEEATALGGGLAKCGSMNMYFKELFPVTSDSASLPFIWTNEMAADWVNMPVAGEMLTKELAASGIVPLVGSPGPQSFFMAKKLPHGIAPQDMTKTFEGLRVRTWGSYTQVVKLLGGTPVAMPASEVPVAIRQGIIDGFVTSWDTWKSLGMQNDAPIAYELPTGATALFAMNKAAFDAYPKAVQDLMRQAAKNAAEQIARLSTEFNDNIIKEAKANPRLQVITATPEEAARWRKAIAPVWEEYTSRGPEHKRYLAEFAKYLEQGYTPSWKRK